MEKYLKDLKHLVIVWLVLGLVTAISVSVVTWPIEGWLEVLMLLVIIFFPLGIFLRCLKIPFYMARDSMFGDKPSSATVLTKPKVLNFFTFLAVFLCASAGYIYAFFNFIQPFLRNSGVW